MNFKKWVKSIQTAGYNGARTVHISNFVNVLQILLHKSSNPSRVPNEFPSNFTFGSNKNLKNE
jgi:hypothetical protein